MNNAPVPSQKPHRKTLVLSGTLLALFLIIADQMSKTLIRTLVENAGTHIEILPFFNLVTVWNHGISFGLMQAGNDIGVYLLIAVASIITALFAALLLKSDGWLNALACGTIIGGALGNIIDRMIYGAVYDFLDFHAFGYHWPAFNLADSCVLIGIAMIALDSLSLGSKSKDTHE